MRCGALAAGIGVVAGTTLAVVAAGHAATTTSSPLRAPDPWSTLLIVGLVGAFALYLVGLVLLTRTRTRLTSVVAVAAAVQLVPLAGPVLLSRDVYSYWDYGRIAAVHGGNPYVDKPSRWPHDPAYERIGAEWQEQLSVYGPAFTFGSELDAHSAGGSARVATLAFRLAAAAAAVSLAPLAAAATGGSVFAAAFAGWNPLFAVHFAGGGHNDVLLATFVLAALALTRRRRAGLAGVAWAVALGVKAVAVFLLPLEALAARSTRRRNESIGFVAAAIILAGLATWRYGFAWTTVFGRVTGGSRHISSLGLPHWLKRVGIPEQVARDDLAIAFVLLYAWLLQQAHRGSERLALCACALLVATPWLQPWYAVWAVPLAAVEEHRSTRLFALALSAYLLVDTLPL